MNQLTLPLDLEVKLQNNDIAFHIHHLIESIPHEASEPFLQNEGCPAYHPRMMLKFILWKESNCKSVALASGLNRTDAHRFYEERMGYSKISFEFKKEI
jgi:hypothetical protein